MTIFLLYLRLMATSLIGMFHMLILKSQDMEETARRANIVYEGFGAFIKRDWKSLAASFATIVVTFLIFGGMVEAGDEFFKEKTYTLFGFDVPLKFVWIVFIELCFYGTGYFGQDFILRRIVKSVQNKLIKQTVDEKTTLIDRQNGTEGVPTPLAIELKK